MTDYDDVRDKIDGMRTAARGVFEALGIDLGAVDEETRQVAVRADTEALIHAVSHLGNALAGTIGVVDFLSKRVEELESRS